MLRIVIVASLAITLQACTRGGDQQPSYLGAALLDADGADREPASGEDHPDLKHVGSNKVLGAMAFQKVTGQTVDPSRLQNRK